MPRARWNRRTRWTALVVVVVVLVLALAGGVAWVVWPRWNEIPRVAWRAMSDADRYELLSLHPYRSLDAIKGDSFLGHEVYGRTVVTDRAIQDRLNRALRAGAREKRDMRVMACFNPRHVIRATRDGVTTDVVICFECLQVQVWHDGKAGKSFLTTATPEAVFDDVLRQAGVPLAPKDHESHKGEHSSEESQTPSGGS